MAYGARLESVLGASPRGFESPILRSYRLVPGAYQGRDGSCSVTESAAIRSNLTHRGRGCRCPEAYSIAQLLLHSPSSALSSVCSM